MGRAPVPALRGGGRPAEAQPLSATLADGGASPFDQAVRGEVRERVEAALREVRRCSARWLSARD